MRKNNKIISKKQAIALTSHDELMKMKEVIGEGPMRFAPVLPERSVQEQLMTMSNMERECFEALIDEWDVKYPSVAIPDELVLRYSRNSPSKKPYDKSNTWKLMALLPKHPTLTTQLDLTMASLEDQMMTKTLFPLPGLKTKDGHDVLYMRPVRYSPHETPSRVVIDNLAYCMNTMVEKESACKNGIAFIANMDDWILQHYGTDYCMKVCTYVIASSDQQAPYCFF